MAQCLKTNQAGLALPGVPEPPPVLPVLYRPPGRVLQESESGEHGGGEDPEPGSGEACICSHPVSFPTQDDFIVVKLGSLPIPWFSNSSLFG